MPRKDPVARAAYHRQHRLDNLERMREYDRLYQQTNKDRLAPLKSRRQIRYYYGLTPEQFDAMLEAQGGGCAICGHSDRSLEVDHDHTCCPGKKTCGKCVRGILCRRCNRGLGCLETVIDATVAYLRR